jgi:hypothetical protein
MGDAFRMERCGKYVNFVARVCGVHKMSGHHTSCMALAVWKGDDGCASMKERVESQFEAAAALAARGVIGVPAAVCLVEMVAGGLRPGRGGGLQATMRRRGDSWFVCRVIAGGDALATNSALGLRGFRCKCSCHYCETPNDMFHIKPSPELTKQRL